MKTLQFPKEYKKALLSGRKCCTIRLGTKWIEEGTMIRITAGNDEIGEAVVTRVTRKKLRDVSEEEVKKDGFRNFQELYKALKKHYKDISLNSPVTIIEFELKPKVERIRVVMGIEKEYFEDILMGRKRKEGRLNDKKRRKIMEGDLIELVEKGTGRRIIARVLEKKDYMSFREMLEKEGFRDFIPRARSLDEALEVYHTIYKPEERKKYGATSLLIRPLILIDSSTRKEELKYES